MKTHKFSTKKIYFLFFYMHVETERNIGKSSVLKMCMCVNMDGKTDFSFYALGTLS